MQKQKYKDLSSFGKKLLSATTLENGLPLIAEYSKGVILADRCSIFIYDNRKDELWTTIADGIERIIIDSKKGIVGQALNIEETILENDPSSNPNFLSDIDQKNRFKTNNLIATPIFSSKKKVIGILELINKDGGFNKEDERFMLFFTNFISGFIELAPLSSLDR